MHHGKLSHDAANSGLNGNTPVGMGIDPNPMDPFETANGVPLTWITSGNLTGADGAIQVSVSLLGQDQPGMSQAVVQPLPPDFTPLLRAAEEVWQSVANIDFVDVPDGTNSGGQAPDIRVGMAALNANIGTGGVTVGLTNYRYLPDGAFAAGTLLQLEDISQLPVVALPDGDFRFQGYNATVFQVFQHELAHAVGIAHNSSDPHAIMNPMLTAANPVPDAQDIAAMQALYGARPAGSLTLSQSDQTLLNNLGVHLTT